MWVSIVPRGHSRWSTTAKFWYWVILGPMWLGVWFLIVAVLGTLWLSVAIVLGPFILLGNVDRARLAFLRSRAQRA